MYFSIFDQNLVEFILLDEYDVHSVALSAESVTLHEKQELVSMDNVDLCMKSEIRYPWIMFT